MGGLIRFCIHRPVFTWCGVIIFVFLGLASYTSLGVTLFPDVELPFVIVQTRYDGASPIEIERMVSQPLEDALADLEGLRTITSHSRDGMSLLIVEMEVGTDTDLALIDVNNSIRAHLHRLPDGAHEPVSMNVDINARPFMIVSFSSAMPETDAKTYIDNNIRPLISRVHGVGQVQIAGGRDREIQIILDPVALSDHRVTFQQVTAMVAANNITNPSGYITQIHDEISLRLVGEFNEVSQLENIIIPTPAGNPIPLSLLGRVIDGERGVRSIARANGESAVQLLISPRPNTDVSQTGREVRRVLDAAMVTRPEFTATYTHDDTVFIESSVTSVMRDTLIGIALTAFVIYLFLGSISATFIVAVSMPVAFIGTFVAMEALGYTLNLITTLGLALSMGTLAMNAILIIENIFRYRDLGYESFEAAEKGTKEVSVAILAGIMTNLGVFLPVAMMRGIAGQFFAPFALTIVFATLLSLWVAMTVTPCMGARVKGNRDTSFVGRILVGTWNWFYEGFKEMFMFLLRRSTRRPILTMLIFVLLTAGSMRMAGLIGTQFIPVTDDGTISIDLILDNNVSLEQTDQRTRLLEDFINSMPENRYIREVVASVGVTMQHTAVNRSSVMIYLHNDLQRPSTQQIADRIRPFLATLEGVDYAIFDTRRAFASPIEIRVVGEDMDVLYSIAEEVRAMGNMIPGIRDLMIQSEMGKPELQISPIRWRLAPLGLNMSDLAAIVRGYLIGRDAGNFRQDGFEYDIVAKLDRRKAGDIHTVSELPIMTAFGLVPLGEMADVFWTDAPTEIRRVDRQRVIVVTGNVRYITSGEGNAKIREALSMMNLPEGYYFEFGGEAEQMADEFAAMFRAMIIAILITFIIVAAITESWAYSVIILMTAPMAMIGVVPLMLITNTAFSLFAMIGLIMLIGLVNTNAIVVVDFAEVLRREEKLHPFEAIEQAAEIRFKSLVMAIATSVVSLLPLAFTAGAGATMRSPIAVVTIGGLIAGGFLALLAIPAAYKIYWMIRLRREAKTKAA